MGSDEQRSLLKDFLASIVTITGDLSNITAPPFVLDTKGTTEIPSYWAENPALFVSPVTSEDPCYRALLVLRSFLSGIRSQCYSGKRPEEGLKKPLNSFLGELFLAKWEDENGLTQMVCEQVSHHPPVTACRIWNDQHDVVAETYNRTSVSLSTAVHVESSGLVLKSLNKLNEHYLLPIPDFKVTNLLSTPSPELSGTYYIPCTSGYMSVVHFAEKGLFSGSSEKHHVTAHVYREADGEDKPVYTIEGSWFDRFDIRDAASDEIMETFDVEKQGIDPAAQLQVDRLEDQDPWESRRAWHDTITALKARDMSAVTKAKNQIEKGQRKMRKDEQAEGKSWSPLFFKPDGGDNKIVDQLRAKLPKTAKQQNRSANATDPQSGWVLDLDRWKNSKKPYHGDLKPDNTRTGNGDALRSSSSSTSRQQRTGADVSLGIHGDGDDHPQFHDGVEHKVGAVDAQRPTPDVVDGTKIDVGKDPAKKHIEAIHADQPGPQQAQTGTREEYVGSGIEGVSLDEKKNAEKMLRDVYASGKPPGEK